jgi:hypothetical protein
MAMGRWFFLVFFTCVSAQGAHGQNPATAPAVPFHADSDPVLEHRAAPAGPATIDPDPVVTHRPAPGSTSTVPETISLLVPKGTAIQVALDREVKVVKVGQPLHGRTVEPIYAFDRLVIPVGAEVNGQITRIENVSAGKRTLDVLDANFTPYRKLEVEFNELILTDGTHFPIHTSVSLGSGQVIEFITAEEEKKGAKDAAAEKVKQAKEEAKREWDTAMEQVKEPGKVRRVERYAIAQLPVHPQYIDAGTVYFAELLEPLDFGSEPLSPQAAAAVSELPPDGTVVHARLITGVSSATSQKGDDVEAMVSKPVFDGDRLILPQGSILKGSVIQVAPAQRLHRNGQLRFVFHDLILPDGVQDKVNATLEGVQAGKADDLKLDSEGGAEAQTPKTRYLQTGIAIGLAALSSAGDGDGDIGNRAAGGAGGFKLIGIAVGMTVRSQPLGMAMGAFGASRSIYTHFISRGRDVVFPKNTAMAIGIGTRPPAPPKPAANDTIQQ